MTIATNYDKNNTMIAEERNLGRYVLSVTMIPTNEASGFFQGKYTDMMMGGVMIGASTHVVLFFNLLMVLIHGHG
jgi:hypothetical protein